MSLSYIYIFFFRNIACKGGKYGEDCAFDCPPNCNLTCEHIYGTCGNCKEGLDNNCSKGNSKWPSKDVCAYIFFYQNVTA